MHFSKQGYRHGAQSTFIGHTQALDECRFHIHAFERPRNLNSTPVDDCCVLICDVTYGGYGFRRFFQ
jgi:hypothetical protein